MEPFKTLKSRTVVLAQPNIDTDQIIPARYLTTTRRDGLGAGLFADRRFDGDGRPRPDFPLNRPEVADCEILLAGHNFGCGSSREHAPWALLDYGFRAVISTGIADIFRSNALRNGLLPVVVSETQWNTLAGFEGEQIEIDLEASTVTAPSGERMAFEVEPFGRFCLLNGTDPLGFLRSREDRITAFEESGPWRR
jgi:3-isopropylmalate/(R)-2-methylmalate dehydratase small subunit